MQSLSGIRSGRQQFRGPKGHGEKIWVFCHRKTQQIIYSFNDKLDGHHSLKQLPFNGKKTKPAKIRKDYWSPMAIIEFPEGKGNVGRDVFQKLRELKHLHEVSWGDEIANKTSGQYTKEEREKVEKAKAEREGIPVFKRSKKQRGMALNARKPFTIADMAAVLSGLGRRNLMWTAEEVVNDSPDVIMPERDEADLLPVSVKWANNGDMNMAHRWTLNVSHNLMDQPDWESVGSPLKATEKGTLVGKDYEAEGDEEPASMPQEEFTRKTKELGIDGSAESQKKRLEEMKEEMAQENDKPKKKSVLERFGF